MFLCPNCNVGMTQLQRVGVELDVCPQCRGVWMDRGELEKILDNERSQAGYQEPPQRFTELDDRGYADRPQGEARRRDGDDDDDDDRRGRRRGGFSLLDLFD